MTAQDGELLDMLFGDAVEEAIVHMLNVLAASFVGGDEEE